MQTRKASPSYSSTDQTVKNKAQSMNKVLKPRSLHADEHQLESVMQTQEDAIEIQENASQTQEDLLQTKVIMNSYIFNKPSIEFFQQKTSIFRINPPSSLSFNYLSMISINMTSEQKSFPLVNANASQLMSSVTSPPMNMNPTPPMNAVTYPPMNRKASPSMCINASSPVNINATPPMNAVTYPPMSINDSPPMSRNALIIYSPSYIICNTFLLNSVSCSRQRQTEQRKARKKAKIDVNEVFNSYKNILKHK